MPDTYEIRVKGHLAPHWAPWFDGLQIEHEEAGTTRLYGTVADQAALHGLLIKIRDLGLILLHVQQHAGHDCSYSPPGASLLCTKDGDLDSR